MPKLAVQRTNHYCNQTLSWHNVISKCLDVRRRLTGYFTSMPVACIVSIHDDNALIVEKIRLTSYRADRQLVC